MSALLVANHPEDDFEDDEQYDRDLEQETAPLREIGLEDLAHASKRSELFLYPGRGLLEAKATRGLPVDAGGVRVPHERDGALHPVVELGHVDEE